MPADGIPAAHSPRTEASARPVSKSSSKQDYTIPHPSKRPSYWPGCRTNNPVRTNGPMSGIGQSRRFGDVRATSALPRRDSDLQINQRRQPKFDWVSFTGWLHRPRCFLRSPCNFEASAYLAAMIAPPDRNNEPSPGQAARMWVRAGCRNSSSVALIAYGEGVIDQFLEHEPGAGALVLRLRHQDVDHVELGIDAEIGAAAAVPFQFAD